MHHNPNQENLLLADATVRMVMKEDDRYAFHPRAAEGFQAALDALFSRTDVDPKAELEGALKLGHLFETEHGAFEIAEGIVNFIAKDGRALSALGMADTERVRSARRQFERLADTEEKLAAPVYGESAPKGSLKVSSFLQPGREIRRQPAKPRFVKE